MTAPTATDLPVLAIPDGNTNWGDANDQSHINTWTIAKNAEALAIAAAANNGGTAPSMPGYVFVDAMKTSPSEVVTDRTLFDRARAAMFPPTGSPKAMIAPLRTLDLRGTGTASAPICNYRTGERWFGALFVPGWLNQEIPGQVVPGKWLIGGHGVGANSAFVGASQTYDFTVHGIVLEGDANTQAFHHPITAGTCYAANFHDLQFHNMRHAFGRPTDGFSATLCTFSGQFTHTGVAGCPFTIRGSDNWFKAVINVGWLAANTNGEYILRCSNLSKTSILYMYITARGGMRAVLVEGPATNQGGLEIAHCVIEGQNKDDPAMGALVKCIGGASNWSHTKFNFGMNNPTLYTDAQDTASFMVTAGYHQVLMATTSRATTTRNFSGSETGEAVPVFDCSGGYLHVAMVAARGEVGWSQKPIARQSGTGTMVRDFGAAGTALSTRAS